MLDALAGPSEPERRARRRERNWEAGADGEAQVAAVLAEHCPAVPVLHDRRLPGSGANIDHIAVAPSGIYVVDSKRYHGKVEVINPLFGKPRLIIAGRNQTRLVEGLAKQVRAVRAVFSEQSDAVPVYGCFCFVAPAGVLAVSGLPALWTLRIADFRLYAPRRLARQLNQPGPLSRADANAVVHRLEDAFVPA
ncbi:MAG: nuclease-related domain-containing protein [Solirubrobacteraceae bacterium]